MLFPVKNAAVLAKLYFLAKIRKRLFDVPGRPVISNCGGVTEKVSEFLDHHLKPIMQSSPTYIRDSKDFLQKLEDLGDIPEGAILVSADVVGLYPNIPHNEGLDILRGALEKRTDKSVATDTLIKMAEFVLTNNFFEFNLETYQQISGTAIGTKFAPSYACIFMDNVEKTMLAGQLFTPWWWKRFINDIFFIWLEDERKLKDLFITLNNLHPTIKFTFEIPADVVNTEVFEELDFVKCIPGKSIHFLDLTLQLEDQRVTSDLYCKPTDGHQYLEYSSSHPRHIKKSIVYSQALRVKRLCSKEEIFDEHMIDLKNWFIKRGYPATNVQEQIDKARAYVPCGGPEIIRKNDGIPLVVTYHPALNGLSQIIRKHFHVLEVNEKAKSVFSAFPIVSFRNCKTLGRTLVRAKMPRVKQKKGSFKCNKLRCLVCTKMVETDEFRSFVTGKSYKINFKLHCDTCCVIYLMSCHVCGKQLVGECTTEWRVRWNNYNDNCRKSLRNQPHFQSTCTFQPSRPCLY